MLEAQFPDVATMLRDAAEDLLAFCGFPVAHWRKIGPPTRSNASTARSNAVPTSSASSPTTPPSSASSPPCSSKRTTNGPSPNPAISPKNP
jgi:hypothetical protein